MDELSPQQRGLVTGTSSYLDSDPALILQTIPSLADLSVTQLCVGCLDQVVNLPPQVWDDMLGHSWSQKPTDMRTFLTEFICSCGMPLGTNRDTPAANRAHRAHKAEVLDICPERG